MRSKRLSTRSQQGFSERRKIIQGLIAGFRNLIVFITALLLSLGLFVDSTTLIWMVDLFCSAFVLNVSPLISDYFQGISYIFEYIFAFGEKLQIPGPNQLEEVIGAISLRSTFFRAPSGD